MSYHDRKTWIRFVLSGIAAYAVIGVLAAYYYDARIAFAFFVSGPILALIAAGPAPAKKRNNQPTDNKTEGSEL